MPITRYVLKRVGIREMYHIAPSMFRANGNTYFYDMLSNLGIKEVNYYENNDGFTKHYGYFVIP